VGYQGRDHLGTGPGLSQALDPTGYLIGRRTNADLTYHNPIFTPYWDVAIQLSYLNFDYKANYVALPAGAKGLPNGMLVNPGIYDHHLCLDTFAFYSGFQKHLIRIGTGYSYHDQYKVTHSMNSGVDPIGQPLPPGSPVVDLTDTLYAFNPEQKRENQYLSLQDIWTITNDWELTAGTRYDDYSDFGKTINPRFALVWQPQMDLTSKLLYGRAFRAPTFRELYNMNNPVAQGNPNLAPEIINTWELAFDYRLQENLHLAANLFRYKATDKIQLVATPGVSMIMFQNIGVLEGHGLELEARWKMSTKSSLLANYSYAKVINKAVNHDAGDYPRHTAYLRTDWLLIPNWYLDVQAKWVSDRQRTLGDPRPPIADYTTVDLTLRYKNLREGRTNIAFSVRNLFNANAFEPSLGPNASGIINIPYDLPLAGRSYFLELRYQF